MQRATLAKWKQTHVDALPFAHCKPKPRERSVRRSCWPRLRHVAAVFARHIPQHGGKLILLDQAETTET